MIEDALTEANKLQEAGAIQNAAQGLINGVKKLAGNATGGQQQPAQGQAEQATDITPPQAADAKTIKDHLNKNPKIDDWPDDWLADLVGFLQQQDDFKSSKSAQAMVQAIQQKQVEAKKDPEKEKVAANDKPTGTDAKGSSTAGVKGDASKVPSAVVSFINNKLYDGGLGKTFTIDDVVAAINADTRAAK